VVQSFVAGYTPRIADPTRQAPVLVQLTNADCAPFLGPVVLRHASVAIREGEILGILGANGAGKSTLGLCLAGLLPLKGGRRKGAPGGYAFQRPETQFTAGTVQEEVETALPKSMPPAHKSARAAEVLAAWGLADLHNRHPFELSQGQKRRLAIAALTASDRWPLLVLDEPTAGLDAWGVSRLVGSLEALQGAGRAIALITHDLDLASRLCPRSIVVGEGGILADGPTQDLMDDAALLRRAGLSEPAHRAAARWLQRSAPC
jgi:energy-coupling factor transport system ATP-binding protein